MNEQQLKRFIYPAIFVQCFVIGMFLRHYFLQTLETSFMWKVMGLSVVAGLVLIYTFAKHQNLLSAWMKNICLFFGIVPFTVLIWILWYFG